MTAYATRSPLQLLTNTYYMMAEQPSSNRRTSARLKVKEDNFATNGQENSKQAGATKQTKSSAKGTATTRSKRKIDYDEEDKGFKFTRAQPKRAKAVAEGPPKDAKLNAKFSEENLAAQGKQRRITPEPEAEAEAEASEDRDEAAGLRRSARKTKAVQIQPNHPISTSDQQNTKASPRKHARREKEQHTEAATEDFAEQAVPNEPTKIALPFADTPIIRRNKAMRKGNNESRRSSLSMRGRRASSLIDSGTSSALPHDQVETDDFYKHIESTLPEPRRMRQLLMWCGARALGKKPFFATEDSETKLAAWQIQQELLKDFASKTELSYWFSRDDSSTSPKTLKPNPRNIANLAKIEELELKLKELRAEQEQWAILQQPPAPESLTISPLPPIEQLALSTVPQTTIKSIPALRELTTSEQAFTAELKSSVQQRINTVKTNFELNLDKLLDSVNNLGQHLSSAEATSKRVLGSVAKVLDEKDRRVVEKEGSVGTMDTLRALTRIIDRS